MTMYVYIVRGPNPNNEDWDTDADGKIFGVYDSMELAEEKLAEVMLEEYGFDTSADIDDMDEDEWDERRYFMKEQSPFIDRRAVQTRNVSSNSRRPKGYRAKQSRRGRR